MTDQPGRPAMPIAKAFGALYELVLYLRGEHGCPWDRAQDLKSMYQCLREETEELGEAIGKDDSEGVTEEWGDVAFIVLMLAAIAEETMGFKTERALRFIEAKMIRRHPHVFGSSDAGAVGEIIAQWERIKEREKDEKSESLMDDIPPFYSALKRAEYVQKTAAGVGFDWRSCEGIIEKIEEEAGELRRALASGDSSEAASELGDLLFSCVNLSRFLGMDGESLLGSAVDKFIERFQYIESQLRRRNKSAREATLEEMDELWERYKKEGHP